MPDSMISYCKTCVIPSTRPNIKFDTFGNCNCATLGEKNLIDWKLREQLFRDLVTATKQTAREQNTYDCVIPVSGGKDSTWQVLKCLEYGLKPLTVTWRSPARTELGQKNLDNLINLGVDHIDFSISPSVERRFMLETLRKMGSPAIPMHLAIHAIPLTVAHRFGIPLIVWGENSAFEYGGTEDQRKGFLLDEDWFKKYGVTQGTTVQDWISSELSAQELSAYKMPSFNEISNQGLRAIFLGYYFRWDPAEVVKQAKKSGFSSDDSGPRVGFYNYADIDDEFIIPIHHFLKWYKFGFTRSFDNLSLEIRNGRMTRDQAIEHLQKLGDETPHVAIDSFCRYVGISVREFYDTIEQFRNHDVWFKEDGVWKIRNFLLKDWKWT